MVSNLQLNSNIINSTHWWMDFVPTHIVMSQDIQGSPLLYDKLKPKLNKACTLGGVTH